MVASDVGVQLERISPTRRLRHGLQEQLDKLRVWFHARHVGTNVRRESTREWLGQNQEESDARTRERTDPSSDEADCRHRGLGRFHQPSSLSLRFSPTDKCQTFEVNRAPEDASPQGGTYMRPRTHACFRRVGVAGIHSCRPGRRPDTTRQLLRIPRAVGLLRLRRTISKAS